MYVLGRLAITLHLAMVASTHSSPGSLTPSSSCLLSFTITTDPQEWVARHLLRKALPRSYRNCRLQAVAAR